MSRQRLETLFDEQQYYFHGSTASGLTELEPRQAYSHGKPDGEPTVYAAYGIDIPIFMAVLGKRGRAGWDNYLYPGFMGFYVERPSYEQAIAENWSGSVYVCNKNDFAKCGLAVMRSLSSVPVIEEVVVDTADLDMNEIAVIDAVEALK